MSQLKTHLHMYLHSIKNALISHSFHKNALSFYSARTKDAHSMKGTISRVPVAFVSGHIIIEHHFPVTVIFVLKTIAAMHLLI